jgi:hypothetical protein
MLKGYPIGPPLQLMLAAENSITHRHIERLNCGEIAAKIAGKIAGLPASCSPHVHNEFSGEMRLNRLDRAPWKILAIESA